MNITIDKPNHTKTNNTNDIVHPYKRETLELQMLSLKMLVCMNREMHS